MKTLVLTVGLPRSGKTTWAQQQGHPIVSPDQIRYALHGERYLPLAEPFVWAIAKVMARALFLAGHNTVVLDATSITRKRRDDWRGPAWSVSFYQLSTPASVCLARGRALNDDYILPIIERMAAEWQPLEPDEIQFEYVEE
jgi:predicted kinase